MKKRYFAYVLFIVALIITVYSLTKPAHSFTKGEYQSGIYESKEITTNEGYVGKAKLTIAKGLITDVDFLITDELGMVFDEKYGPARYYNHAAYLQQCVDELAGIKRYKSKLLQAQDIAAVNVISGATWSYDIFCNAVSNALKKANN
jgi:major membrane immunogen (membrane-anchored lipoprotein)